jgi:hypothetical protein
MLERSIKIPWAEESRKMAEEETAEQKTKASSHQFIPKLLGQKITIRPAQGQPITGILRGTIPMSCSSKWDPSRSSYSRAQSGALRSWARGGDGKRGWGAGRGRNP